MFTLSFWDISLLLAFLAIVLLITSALISHQYGATKLRINKKKLKNAAFVASFLFLSTVAIKVVTIIFSQL